MSTIQGVTDADALQGQFLREYKLVVVGGGGMSLCAWRRDVLWR